MFFDEIRDQAHYLIATGRAALTVTVEHPEGRPAGNQREALRIQLIAHLAHPMTSGSGSRFASVGVRDIVIPSRPACFPDPRLVPTGG